MVETSVTLAGNTIMKPADFAYVNPKDVREVLDVLHEYREHARIIAGGLSLGAMLNYRLVEPDVLVDISKLDELSYIRREGNYVEVGASATQADLMNWPDLQRNLPLLHSAMPDIGHFQTRSRGTVCGNICHADPSSELPLCFALLDGEAVLRSIRGERRLSAAQFQSGMMSNASESDEIVTAVRFPVADNGEGFAFREFARRSGDFAIVAVAARVSGNHARLGVGGVAERPFIRDWQELPADNIVDEMNRLAWELRGYSDIHADAGYRRRLVRRLGKQVIEEATGNAVV